MDVKLRPGTLEDAGECGRICYQAFASIAGEHHFSPDFPTPETAVGMVSALLAHPGFYAVVAEVDGAIAGSNFLDERSPIVGVGPITVDPGVQNRGLGRILMQDVLRRAAERGVPGIRLLQDAYHSRSLSLYARLGFQIRDLVACMQGTPPRGEIPGYTTRHAAKEDVEPCNAVSLRVHGHHRAGELTDAIAQGAAVVVEHDGRITGYATGLAFFAHAVGESNEDLRALIMSADAFGGPGILVPTTNGSLFGWCLEQELRVVKTMTLMSMGLYSRPRGAFLPSVLY